ncbi:hypothetical protein NDU88_002081 [Pleurodeles waltl]|uniref:Uncharacterized protein n=1 Tax=Pleurodeles waltl TaxID=8319 RepID=A0AAV7LD66_PLEWA|nr:hypothetical protein NDU88_002081 [Pleurodeles waltl]
MAMAMSGAEESFHQVLVRKATSGEVESSRSQTSMACLRAERVLRSMQWRWLVLILGGGVSAGVECAEGVGVVANAGGVAVAGARGSGAGCGPGADGRRRACLGGTFGAPVARPLCTAKPRLP